MTRTRAVAINFSRTAGDWNIESSMSPEVTLCSAQMKAVLKLRVKGATAGPSMVL